MGARNHHELMRAWENNQRVYQAEATSAASSSERKPVGPVTISGLTSRKMDDANWKCFVNCQLDPKTGQWKDDEERHLDHCPVYSGSM